MLSHWDRLPTLWSSQQYNCQFCAKESLVEVVRQMLMWTVFGCERQFLEINENPCKNAENTLWMWKMLVFFFYAHTHLAFRPSVKPFWNMLTLEVVMGTENNCCSTWNISTASLFYNPHIRMLNYNNLFHLWNYKM